MAPRVLLPRAVCVQRECDIVKKGLSSLLLPEPGCWEPVASSHWAETLSSMGILRMSGSNTYLRAL